jgi:hypothetical protein
MSRQKIIDVLNAHKDDTPQQHPSPPLLSLEYFPPRSPDGVLVCCSLYYTLCYENTMSKHWYSSVLQVQAQRVCAHSLTLSYFSILCVSLCFFLFSLALVYLGSSIWTRLVHMWTTSVLPLHALSLSPMRHGNALCFESTRTFATLSFSN